MVREKRFDPAHWASLKPFGIGEGRPNNYLELWKAFRENRGRRGYAWRILKHGTCDGCALGTVGMRDWTTDEVHLCNVRLRLLRLTTMPAMDPGVLSDVDDLRGMSGAELRNLGRLPQPMIREHGDAGFRTISWDEALDLAAGRLAEAAPDRFGVYLTSRGTPNETYYAVQKAVRALGSNSIDNAARVCHAPSTVALKQAIGVAATTCSYADWIGSDLIVFIGSNVANNQPVAMKYLYHARKVGTRVAVVNPYREPGMDRYWVPSNIESAVFGTRITDRFFSIAVGGDAGFLNGVLKHMVEKGWVDDAFVEAHTTGFSETAAAVAGQSWEELEAASGTTRAEMEGLALMLHEARTGVLVWSMGVTQHVSGEDNVRAIVNLGLAKGFVGRKHCGLMPIRGHSGVQGGAEMGAYTTALPGGVPVTPESAAALGAAWGFPVPATPGLTAPEMLDSAHDGRLDVLVSSGGNFLDVLPDPEYTASALGRVPLRVHIDICLSSQMLVDPADVVLLLPGQTRYEMEGGNTETSTERRVIFNPEVPGPRVAGAWPEWRTFTEMAARARPDLADLLRYSGTAAIRDDIALTVPGYEQIRELALEGDQFQWGGEHLCEGGRFPTPDGRARFHAVALAERPSRPEGSFVVATRRGKQFNSMVHEHRDPLNGAERDAVLMNPSDAAGLGVGDGDAVLLRSDHGKMRVLVQTAPVAAGSLQVHWPEAQALLSRRARSAESGIPDYNAVVTVEPERTAPGAVAP